MSQKMYTQKIDDLKNRLHKYWNKASGLSYKNSHLQKENEDLKNENDILKSELEQYKQTEEIEFIDRLISDDCYIDSYGEDVLNRIKTKLTK